MIEQLRSVSVIGISNLSRRTSAELSFISIRNRTVTTLHESILQKSITIFCCTSIAVFLVSIPYFYCVNAQEWVTFTDPNGKYTLQLPPEIEPSAPDPGENTPLVLNFVSNEYPGSAQIIISVVTSSDKSLNLTLNDIKDLSMAVNSQSLPTFHILSEPTYTKYKIGNDSAVSYTFGYGMSEKTKELYVGTKINSTIFHIGYAAQELQYDHYLPIAEKVINSIKVLKSS
jgi:hypothetical protein